MTAGDTWPVWLVAARVDLRLGKVVERWHSPEQGEPSPDEDEVLLRAVETVGTQKQPPEVILFSDSEVHLYRRSAKSTDMATVVVGKRHHNLERLLAVMRHVSRMVDL